jgi:methylenetetrahydrofolate dehydrogenase (NADP+)/methenyltetrahydrofolate cyclohydrolase
MQSKIIDGKEVASIIKSEIKDKIKKYIDSGKRKPKLSVVLVGNDAASKIYVSHKNKTCLDLGIESDMHFLDEKIEKQELFRLIDTLNEDNTVDGILVQLPLPKHIPESEVINRINPLKDVDCFHPENVGLMFTGEPRFLPCTPSGIIELLKYKNVDLSGKHAVVIGRSNIVGKPVSMLLLSNNCTVTICHSRTKDLKEITKQADILVVAIGVANFVKADMIKNDSIIIDVGMNRVDGKLFGDVDFDGVIDKVSMITPVPGGVGQMTIAMLMQNTLKAYNLGV